MKLLHNYTNDKGMPAVSWYYTDNDELNSLIDATYQLVLEKYGYDTTIKSEVAQHKIDPLYGLEVVYDIENELYHHVKEQFMYNYGGLKKPKPNAMDKWLDTIKEQQGVNDDKKEFTNMFNARVELYTNIVVLFQEFGGIPKIATN